MSPELRAALEAAIEGKQHESLYPRHTEAMNYEIGYLDAVMWFAEKNPTIPDRALCQCWGDVIQAAIPAALWDRVSKETA